MQLKLHSVGIGIGIGRGRGRGVGMGVDGDLETGGGLCRGLDDSAWRMSTAVWLGAREL